MMFNACTPWPHQRCDGCIDQSVALELRTPFESLGNHDHAEVAAFAGARVSGVPGAVVDDLERPRCQFLLQRCAQRFNFGWFP